MWRRFCRWHFRSAGFRLGVGLFGLGAIVASFSGSVVVALTSLPLAGLAALILTLPLSLAIVALFAAPVLRLFGLSRYYSALLYVTRSGDCLTLRFGSGWDALTFAGAHGRSVRRAVADCAGGVVKLVEALTRGEYRGVHRVRCVTWLLDARVAARLALEPCALNAEDHLAIAWSRLEVALSRFVLTGRFERPATQTFTAWDAPVDRLLGKRVKLAAAAERLRGQGLRISSP